MVSQGIVQEAKLDSYNSPHYTPSVKELKAVINMEGSFHLDKLQITKVNWDTNDRMIMKASFLIRRLVGRMWQSTLELWRNPCLQATFERR
ncbi:salicylate carboxymethyltransferase-like protein [Cinnamomum micranthum f. kanehirae]|uniref:Salicylate carboxymethyltransferase-like protein n=1 Tax=Cinnamomum micranthum f. kanehirae TaxID=337451 RepID=A0A443P6M3_9MAGN|nr:salicylate carboxymethyltransferase-like protein [Cinnamomum micranthum f. kanehirae]